MYPRVDIQAGSPFNEIVGLFGHIAAKRVEQEKSIRPNEKSKIDVSSVTGKITTLRISKSLVRQLIYKGDPYPVCPYKVYRTLLLRDISAEPSEAQIRGLYFESKCLGLSADGSSTIDLPRHKKTGAKLAEHERIDQAVERFFSLVKDYNMVIDPTRVQKYNMVPWNDRGTKFPFKVHLDGILDFISPITAPGYCFDAATFDLKLTRDRQVMETFSNGLYHSTPWGNMENTDFTEAMIYRMVFGLPFVYLVFDYKKDNSGFKDIPISTDVNDPDPKKAEKARTRMYDLTTTIRRVISSIAEWQSKGWEMIPIAKVCSGCPIMDCSKRNETSEI